MNPAGKETKMGPGGESYCSEHKELMAAVKRLDRDIIEGTHNKTKMNEHYWSAIHSKLDRSTFKWFVGIMITILLAFAAFQWGTYASIHDTKERIIEVKTRLEERISIEKTILEKILEGKKQ